MTLTLVGLFLWGLPAPAEVLKDPALSPPVQVARPGELTPVFGILSNQPEVLNKNTLKHVAQFQAYTNRPLKIFRKEGEDLPEELVQLLKENEIRYRSEVVENLDDYSQFKTPWLQHVGEQIAEARGRAVEASDWTMAGMTGTYQLATATYVWAIHHGFSPLHAAAMISAQTMATFGMTVGLSKLDGFFTKDWSSYNPNDDAGLLPQLLKRQFLLVLPFTELWRIMSGPVGEAHSAFTLAGQYEVAANALSVGLAGSLLGVTRNAVFKNDPVARRWMNFNGFLLVSPLVMMDLSGIHLGTLAKFGVMEVHGSMVLMLGTYLSTAAAIRFLPPVRNFVSKLARKQEAASEGVKKIVQKTARFVCPWAFKKLAE